MPRLTRLFLPDVPLHLIQRGNNRQCCFHDRQDYQVYLKLLFEHAQGCRIHAYVLMSNHVHLLLSADTAASSAALMKALAQRYAQYFNWRHRRSGSLWDGRYKSCLVQSETYFMLCQRYIELNPVRAGMVNFPAQYCWSSYRCNAEGKVDRLVSPHSIYERLGLSAADRQQAYRALFQETLPQQTVNTLRDGINGNFAVGEQQFLHELKPTA